MSPWQQQLKELYEDMLLTLPPDEFETSEMEDQTSDDEVMQSPTKSAPIKQKKSKSNRVAPHSQPPKLVKIDDLDERTESLVVEEVDELAEYSSRNVKANIEDLFVSEQLDKQDEHSERHVHSRLHDNSGHLDSREHSVLRENSLLRVASKHSIVNDKSDRLEHSEHSERSNQSELHDNSSEFQDHSVLQVHSELNQQSLIQDHSDHDHSHDIEEHIKLDTTLNAVKAKKKLGRGDQVIICRTKVNQNMEKQPALVWEGPFTIIKKVKKNIFRVGNNKKVIVVHVKRMKRVTSEIEAQKLTGAKSSRLIKANEIPIPYYKRPDYFTTSVTKKMFNHPDFLKTISSINPIHNGFKDSYLNFPDPKSNKK
jgi:hypothetical protein